MKRAPRQSVAHESYICVNYYSHVSHELGYRLAIEPSPGAARDANANHAAKYSSAARAEPRVSDASREKAKARSFSSLPANRSRITPGVSQGCAPSQHPPVSPPPDERACGWSHGANTERARGKARLPAGEKSAAVSNGGRSSDRGRFPR